MENRLLVSTPEIKTPRLQEAIKANDFAKLQGLLREGYSLEDQDAQGNLPIHIAASSGNIEIIQYLLGLKSPLEKVNREKQNPLHIAAAHGHVEAVALLLRKGIPVEAVDINQRTALHLAVANQRLAVVEQLVAAHTNVLMQDQMGSTPLHLAATYGLIDIMRLLADKVSGQFKALLNMQDQDGKTPTHCAAFTSNTVCMKFLLKHGANINAITDYGYTPLFFAIRDNNLKMVKLLLKRGAFLFIDNINNQTPIQYARELVKAPELTKVLLKARRQAIKQVPQTLTASLSRLLLQGDKALDKQQLGEAREHYYQALSQSHIAGNIHLTLWSWQKVLKLALVQQQFDLAAKALMAMEQALCQAQQQSFPSVRVLQQGRWLANYQFSILEHCVKAFRQGKFLNMALVHLDKFKGEISTDNLTKQRRQQLVSLRSAVKQSLLQNETPIPNLLAQITDKFKALVREIVNYSMQVLGEAPCEYALVGLGSMSRNEMSTHSDLECAILIGENTEDNKAYFRQLTRLMELQLIFLGETRVRGAYLPVESPIAAGFGLDSDAGLSPLGIEEAFDLIGTPYRLAQFHEHAHFMGGERLQSNALKNVCLIVGNEKLVTLYEEYMQKILVKKHKPDQTLRQQQALTMMKNELKWHAPDLSEKKREERAFNIKNELYRLPNTILNNLAVYYHLTSKNAWERIKELHKKGKLTTSASQHWQRAMTDIARLRLLTHLYYGCEQEHIHHQLFVKPATLTESMEIALPLAAGPQLIFSEEQIQKLFTIYQVLLPLYRAMKVFVDTQGKDKRFKKEKLVEDVLTAQGETFMRALRYKEAIEVYQKALAADPNNLDIRLKLAQAYSLLGDPTKQKDLLLDSWQLYQSINQAKPVQGIRILISLSVAYAQLDDVLNQQQYALQASALCSEHFAETHIEMAKCKMIVADAYGEMGQSEKQITMLQQALAIYENQEQESIEADKAVVLVNLGAAYAAQGDYAKAKTYLEQGLLLEKKTYGDKHPTVATTLINLANVYGAQWNVSEKIQLLQAALAIQEAVYGNEHPQVAITLNNLGNAYGRLKNLPLCVASLHYALQIQERHLSPTHPQIAITLVNLSNAYANMGEQEKLKATLTQIDTLLLELTTKKVPSKELPKLLISLSETYSTLEDWPKAAVLIEQALGIQKTLQVPANQQAPLLTKLYGTYVQISDAAKQKATLKRLLALYQTWHGEGHVDVAKVYVALGAWYEQQAKAQQQVKVLEQALGIYDRLGITDKRHLEPVLEGLQAAYEVLGEAEKMQAIAQRQANLTEVPDVLEAKSASDVLKRTSTIIPASAMEGIKNVGLRSSGFFMQPKLNASSSEPSSVEVEKERIYATSKPISESKKKNKVDKKEKKKQKKQNVKEKIAKKVKKVKEKKDASDELILYQSESSEEGLNFFQLQRQWQLQSFCGKFHDALLTYVSEQRICDKELAEAMKLYQQLKPLIGEYKLTLDLDIANDTGYTTLHWLVRHRDEKNVALLLENGADVNKADDKGWTSLHIAAFRGHLNIARLLLLQGAQTTHKTTTLHSEDDIDYPVGCTPLEIAKLIDHTYMVQLLTVYEQNKHLPQAELIHHLTAISDISFEPQFTCMDLISAVQCGDLIAAESYLKAGADPNSKIKAMPLIVYAAKHIDQSMCQLLLQYGADINAADDKGNTGIYLAARTGMLTLFKLFLENKANINCKNNHDHILHAAVAGKNILIIKILLDANLDINVQDAEGDPPLQWAAVEDISILNLLISKGADLNILNQDGNTTLHMCIHKNKKESAEVLLKAGASVFIKNKNNMTPMQLTEKNDNQEMIKILLPYVEQAAKTKFSEIILNQKCSSLKEMLILASQNNDEKIVVELLESDIDFCSKDKKYNRTALHWAVLNNNYKLVELIIKKGVDVNLTDNYGWPALYYALYYNYENIVNVLLEAKADAAVWSDKIYRVEQNPLAASAHCNGLHIAKLVGKKEIFTQLQACIYQQKLINAEDTLNNKLIAAVRSHDVALTHELLKEGASPDIYDGDWPLFLYAVASSEIELVKALQAHNVDIFAEDKELQSNALDIAVRYMPNILMVKYILELGFDINRPRPSNKATPLIGACFYSSLEVVKFLIENGADVTLVNESGETPLIAAADCEYLTHELSAAIANYLITQTKSDIHAKTYRGDNAIYKASIHGHITIVKQLLDLKVSFDEANIDEWTALYAACQYNNSEIVQCLIKAGANINIMRKDNNRTPLISAIEDNSVACVKVLLEAGAEYNYLFDEGDLTPLQMAAEEGYLDIVKLLLAQADIQVDKPNKLEGQETGLAFGDRTALIRAAMNGHVEIIKLLLEAGANINHIDAKGWTPLKIAIHGNHINVVRVLLQHPNIDPNMRLDDTRFYIPPLILAINQKSLEIVELLLAHSDIDVNLKSTQDTPLTAAIKLRAKEIVNLLLEKTEIDINAVDCHGQSFLQLIRSIKDNDFNHLINKIKKMESQSALDLFLEAAESGNIEIIDKSLNENLVDVNEANQVGQTALIIASKCNQVQVVKRLLHEPYIDFNSQDDDQNSALYYAAHFANKEVVKMLVNVPDIDINQVGNFYQTPLINAAQSGDADIVQLLLSKNADPNLSRPHLGNDGLGPLHFAMRCEHSGEHYECNFIKTIDLLTNHPEININNQTVIWATHQTPLMYARKYAEFLRMILTHPNVKLNLVNKNGYSVLTQAATWGYTETLYMLLARPGIAVNLPSKEGYTPLYCAASNNHIDCLEALLQAKDVDVNKASNLGKTPLYIAAENGYLNSVKLLVEAVDTNLNRATKKGETPLMAAVQKGHTEVVKVLVESGADLFCVNNLGMTARQLAYAKGEPKVGALLKEMEDKYHLAQDEKEQAYLQTELHKTKAAEKELVRKASLANLSPLEAEKNKKQLETNHKDQQTITRLQQIKQWQTQVRTYILENDALKKFFYDLHGKLAECLYAYKNLTQLSAEELGNIQRSINLLNHKINLPAVKFIASYLTDEKEQIKEKERMKVNFILHLINNSMQLDCMMEVSARLLTFEFEQQIKALKDQEQINLLVESIVARLLDVIEAGEVNEKTSLFQQIQYALTEFKAKQSVLKITDKRLKVLKDSKEPWTDRGVFQQSGMMLVDGRCFADKETKADVYGYRLVDEATLAIDIVAKPSQAPHPLSKDNPLLVKEIHVNDLVTQIQAKSQSSLLQRLGIFGSSVQNNEVSEPIDMPARKHTFLI